MMQILGLFAMYFDAAVVFVTNSSLLFRLAMAIMFEARVKPIFTESFFGDKKSCHPRKFICS